METKLQKLIQGVYLLPGTTNIGVIIDKEDSENTVYLVDSGASFSNGRYVLQTLSAFFSEKNQTFTIKAIINTHSHADHFGANDYIQKNTSCEIWTCKTESYDMNYPPELSTILWGAYPPALFRNEFYNPKPSVCNRYLSEEDKIILDNNREISFLSLPGHCKDLLGVLIQDNSKNKKVLFASDAIFPATEIIRYWVPYIFQPDFFLESLKKICSIDNLKLCVPGHGPVIKNCVPETAELNEIAVISTKQCILKILKKSELTTEQIIKKTADKMNIKLSNGLYILFSSTILSYLSVLSDDGKITFEVINNELVWHL